MKKLLIFDLQGTLVKSMRPPILNGSPQTIKQLSKYFTLAIFTGASTTETNNILKKTRINLYFKTSNIITKGLFPKKPSPTAIFQLILQNNSPKTYYIGDTRKDYLAAQNAQIPFIYIGRQKLGITQIRSLDELLNVKIKL